MLVALWVAVDRFPIRCMLPVRRRFPIPVWLPVVDSWFVIRGLLARIRRLDTNRLVVSTRFCFV